MLPRFEHRSPGLNNCNEGQEVDRKHGRDNHTNVSNRSRLKTKNRIRAKRNRAARKQHGASLFLIAGAAILLCCLIYLGFQYCMMLGGAREVRNGVDAAVLNLSKQVCGVKVPPGPAYGDVADTSGFISMANINRVWGKAYLINANVDEMKTEGTISGEAIGSGELAYQYAQQVNDNLRDTVTAKSTLDALFSNLADKRGAAMLGAGKIDREQRSTYPIALVDRGAESNLSFNPAGLPKAANPSNVQLGNSTYLQGYTPFTANSKTFCFTPFRRGETPHLISDTIFTSSRADAHPLNGFDMPIPNAFQGSGTAFGTTTSLAAAASASVNPMQQYAMAIPHAYIRINFSAISYWFVDSKKINTIKYRPNTGQVNGIKEYKLKNSNRVLNGFAELGTEYKKGSFYDVVHALPGDHTPAMQRLLQRGQEIDPDFTLGKLRAMMQQMPPDPTVTTYYLFPRYQTADLTDPTLELASANKNMPDWLDATARAEGGVIDVVKEDLLMDYEHAHCYIYGGTPTDCPKWMELTGVCRWFPGTGMGQCLGQLNINRTTTVKFKPGTED